MATNKPSNDKSTSKPSNDKKPENGAAKAATTAQPTPAAAPTAAAAPATAPATTPAATADKPAPDPSNPKSYKGLPRLRFYSVTAGKEDYCVRILPIFLDKYGAPKDPWGETMALRAKQARELGGDGVPAKVKKIEAKEQREKLLASMTDAEKLAFVTKEREERSKAKNEKKAAEKAKLMAELRKELESQGLVVKA